MRIDSVGSKMSVNKLENKNVSNITFKGLKDDEQKSMFVFDLDGTFAMGNAKEINKVVEIAKNKNAKLIYATGRNKGEVEKLQNKLKKEGIELPTPDYLISNNGQFLFENFDGVLVENMDYKNLLKEKTNFERAKVLNALQELAHSEKYSFSKEEMKKLKSLENFSDIKQSDPEFYDSKISYYEWNASEFMCEYFLSKDIDAYDLKKDVVESLEKQNIKPKFIENAYSEKIMDLCNEKILLQSHSLRRNENGGMTALFICPADKADGVKYVKEMEKVSYNEILLAGNDDNDVSMAKLALLGSNFVCLNNASAKLKAMSTFIQSCSDKIFISQFDGVKGIIEGINKFTKKDMD